MIRALIVVAGLLGFIPNAHAKDNNPFSGATSITVNMTRDAPKIDLSLSRKTARNLSDSGGAETCTASQYGIGDGYHGRRTASGAIFNTWSLTAAHRTRPFGSRVLVTNLRNGRAVAVRINDRGPFVKGRCIDLSRAAARAIGMAGLARVTLR